jgi:hypothetical protein
MMTLRCTQKVLNYCKWAPQEADLPATTTLGDWYANLLFTKHHRLLLCTSETSLLSVLIPLKNMKDIGIALAIAVRLNLERHGVSENLVSAEISQMKPISIGKTKSRVVLGVMNDLMLGAKIGLEIGKQDQVAVEDRLCETILSPNGYKHPIDVAKERIHYWARRRAH